MIRYAVIALALLATPAMAAKNDPPIVGKISKVHDGDTFFVNGIKIRLHGVDAPEAKQTCAWRNGVKVLCGKVAAERLKGLIGEKPVTCQKTGVSFERMTARCSVDSEGKPLDLGSHLVYLGFAWADPRYATQNEVNDMIASQRARRGLWDNGHDDPRQGFQNPRDWREEQKAKARADKAAKDAARQAKKEQKEKGS